MTSYIIVYEAGLPLMAGYNHSQEYLRQNLGCLHSFVCKSWNLKIKKKNMRCKCIRARAPLKICLRPPGEACPLRLGTAGIRYRKELMV